MRIDKWDMADPSDHLPEKDAKTEDKAVYVGDQRDKSVVLAEKTEEEWIVLENLDPLTLEESR